LKHALVVGVLRIELVSDRPQFATINAWDRFKVAKPGVGTAGKCLGLDWLSHRFVSSELWSSGDVRRGFHGRGGPN
jgi:hypothetical protein